MFKLKNWAVIGKDWDGYTAPELRKIYLKGQVFDNPKFPDGSVVSTSHIVSSTGKAISTASGSVYFLEEPATEYLEWLTESGYTFSEENPIVLHKVGKVLN